MIISNQKYLNFSNRRTVFTNENDILHDHTNDTQHKAKIIEIPDELRRLYESQTGLEVQSTYFREPGAHTETSNTVREFVGTAITESSSTGTETIFKFDFTKDPYVLIPTSGTYNQCIFCERHYNG